MTDHILFQARASSDKEPIVLKVLSEFERRGFSPRQALLELCAFYDGGDRTGGTLVKMDESTLRLHLVDIYESVLRDVVPPMLDRALAGAHLTSVTPTPARPAGRVEPGLGRLIGMLRPEAPENPVIDRTDYEQW